jgi:hypothetical protein
LHEIGNPLAARAREASTVNGISAAAATPVTDPRKERLVWLMLFFYFMTFIMPRITIA